MIQVLDRDRVITRSIRLIHKKHARESVPSSVAPGMATVGAAWQRQTPATVQNQAYMQTGGVSWQHLPNDKNRSTYKS